MRNSIIIVITLLFFNPVFAKKTNYKNIRGMVKGYQKVVKNNKSYKAKKTSLKKLIGKLNKIKVKKAGKTYNYLFKVRSALNTIDSTKLNSKGCELAKSTILYNFGHAPTMSYKKAHPAIRDGLVTLKLFCPKLRI